MKLFGRNYEDTIRYLNRAKQITHTSYHELDLTLGTPVYITFKSSAVNVF